MRRSGGYDQSLAHIGAKCCSRAHHRADYELVAPTEGPAIISRSLARARHEHKKLDARNALSQLKARTGNGARSDDALDRRVPPGLGRRELVVE